MATVVAVIPVLLGSRRVPDKNILLVDGRILCSYSIESCLDSGAFSDVFLNSEDGVFGEIARDAGVEFYVRHPSAGGRACTQKTKSRDCRGNRCVLNEHYLYDFMKNATSADYVCQVNATSPLLRPETIRGFVKSMVDGDFDSYFATTEIRAEAFYEGSPVTFSKRFKRPSNELTPLQVVCWAIAGWRRSAFIESYDRDDPKEDGPVFVGRQGIYPIDEREAMDIDEWSTLDIVERFIISRREDQPRTWIYMDGRTVTPE